MLLAVIKSICPGCGVELESSEVELDRLYNASRACRALYDEVAAFTLSLREKEFIHQLAVDSYAAQHDGPRLKPISAAFALIGLYLTFERGYTGRQVQLAHMELGRVRRTWPRFKSPGFKGALTMKDVVPLTSENYRAKLLAWGKSVWLAWAPEHDRVRGLVASYLISGRAPDNRARPRSPG